MAVVEHFGLAHDDVREWQLRHLAEQSEMSRCAVLALASILEEANASFDNVIRNYEGAIQSVNTQMARLR